MKKIISIKRNPSLGTIIVVRSPFSRKWLFNLSIAPKRELKIKTHLNNALAKGAYAFTLVAIVAACFMGGVK